MRLCDWSSVSEGENKHRWVFESVCHLLREGMDKRAMVNVCVRVYGLGRRDSVSVCMCVCVRERVRTKSSLL